MLQKLMSLLKAAPEQTRTERVAALDLEGKPITKALLIRATEYQDEAIRFAMQLGNERPVAQEASLSDFTAGCAASIANKVTYDALKALGRPEVFFPYEPLPKYAPMAVAFGLFVLASIHSHLKTEGVDIEFPPLAAQTAGLFFVGHPEAERIEHAKRGIAAFQSLAKSDMSNVVEWQEGLFKIVPLYILQWTTTKKELKDLDFNALFASKLASLLKAIE